MRFFDFVRNDTLRIGFKTIFFILIVLLTVASAITVKQIFTSGNIKQMDIQSASVVIPTFTPTATPSSITVSTNSILDLPKDTYTIALYGDSMIDTMGEKLEILQKELYRSYPKTTFYLYNYGVGAQNIETGVARFENSFSNKERVYAPITTINPDIIILGTFAYNPFVPHDLEKYKRDVGTLIQKAKNVSSQVYLLAEIAPKKTGFGQGEFGVNWPQEQAYQQSLLIIDQIRAAVSMAAAEGISVINAYQQSLLDDDFGNPIFVREEDGIHPSFEGHVLMAKTIISSLKFR